MSKNKEDIINKQDEKVIADAEDIRNIIVNYPPLNA